MKRIHRWLLRFVVFYVPLTLCMVFVLFPFYWCVLTALKEDKEILSKTVTYLPRQITMDNFIYAWNNVGFDKYFVNSLIVSLSVVAGILLCSVLVAYPMTRFRFKGKKLVMFSLLSFQFLPAAMMIIPLFIIFKHLHLINSLSSVILATLTFNVPFCSILMIGFMKNIPVQIEEAARIDGCNRVQALIKVICPILSPGIVAVGAFAFINAWKEYLYTLMFINSSSRMTISVGLSSMMSEYSISYGLLAAGCVIAMVPPILAFSYVQKFLVQGLASGSVKE